MSGTRRVLIQGATAVVALLVGLGLPTGAYGPSISVALFVLICSAFRSSSLLATLVFVLVVGLLPSIFFGIGYTYHHPVLESASTSIRNFFLDPHLALIFFGMPLGVGLVLQGCIYGLSNRNVAHGL